LSLMDGLVHVPYRLNSENIVVGSNTIPFSDFSDGDVIISVTGIPPGHAFATLSLTPDDWMTSHGSSAHIRNSTARFRFWDVEIMEYRLHLQLRDEWDTTVSTRELTRSIGGSSEIPFGDFH